MPKDYSNDPLLGHRFPTREGDHQTCSKCGLVRHVWFTPEITCPGRPLDEVHPGWGAKYGTKR